MLSKFNFFIILFLVIIKTVFPQNGLKVHKISSSDFLIEVVETDVLLNQNTIHKKLEDGEYFIYYDTALTQLWMNGVIFDNKLEGKWEFRNKNGEIFSYKMFTAGKEISMSLPENKFAKIYLPDKIYAFNAYYISNLGDTLTQNKVTLHTDSQLYEVRHNTRFSGAWTFNYTHDDSLLLGGIYPWNNWENSTLCLITENMYKIKIYPPRRNQYVFTEVIEFPSVSPVNLKIGYKWQSQTSLPENYRLEKWANTTFYHHSEITGKKGYVLDKVGIECWVVKGSSFNKDYGISFFEYLFNEEFGFVRMEWINYDKQKAVFELNDVTENIS